MRKLYLVLTSAALAAFSAGATFYLLKDPRHTQDEDQIIVGPTAPGRVVSPDQILVKPAAKSPLETDSSSDEEAESSLLASDDEFTSALRARAVSNHPPVVFPDWQSGNSQIVDGQSITVPDDFVRPRWSPVGLDIAFTDATLGRLWIAGPDASGKPRLLADDPGVGLDFSWNLDGMSVTARTADGRWIDILITGEKSPAAERPLRIYERDGAIYVQSEGQSEPLVLSGLEDWFSDPILSPDETKVVYRGAETGLYMAAADGSRTINLGPGEHPTWSPDSNAIVYDRVIRDDLGPVDGDLWLATADGRERTNITNTPGVLEMYPHLAPDGQRIVFIRDGAVAIARLRRGE